MQTVKISRCVQNFALRNQNIPMNWEDNISLTEKKPLHIFTNFIDEFLTMEFKTFVDLFLQHSQEIQGLCLMKMPRKFQNLVLAENTGSFSIPWLCVVCLEYPPMVSTVEFFVRNTVTFVTVRQNAKEFKKSQYSNQIKCKKYIYKLRLK